MMKTGGDCMSVIVFFIALTTAITVAEFTKPTIDAFFNRIG